MTLYFKRSEQKVGQRAMKAVLCGEWNVLVYGIVVRNAAALIRRCTKRMTHCRRGLSSWCG